MKVMIDTNILLDVVFDREGLADTSAQVLNMCENKTIAGIITASTITDIFYIVRKALHDSEATYNVLGNIMDIVSISPVTEEHIKTAYYRHEKDFEDCLLSVCAEAENCKCIVTRNKKDYKGTEIMLVTPEELLSFNNLR